MQRRHELSGICQSSSHRDLGNQRGHGDAAQQVWPGGRPFLLSPPVSTGQCSDPGPPPLPAIIPRGLGPQMLCLWLVAQPAPCPSTGPQTGSHDPVLSCFYNTTPGWGLNTTFSLLLSFPLLIPTYTLVTGLKSSWKRRTGVPGVQGAPGKYSSTKALVIWPSSSPATKCCRSASDPGCPETPVSVHGPNGWGRCWAAGLPAWLLLTLSPS